MSWDDDYRRWCHRRKEAGGVTPELADAAVALMHLAARDRGVVAPRSIDGKNFTYTKGTER